TGDWRGAVQAAAGAGNDWFPLRFALEVDGERWPLLPLLMPLLASGSDRPLPARVSLPLAVAEDGTCRCVDLPGERLAPFLATLRDLFDGQHWRGDGTELAISRYESALV